jgi:hypothetical protein
VIRASNRLLTMVVVFLLASSGLIYSLSLPKTLSVHIGKSYEQVTKDSSFPVEDKTVIYPGSPPHPSSLWISSPVVITFDDPKHGFSLPATLFGAVGFDNWKVSNITTSPMLEVLPFDQMIVVLDQLQGQLNKAGWIEWNAETNPWVKTSTEADRKQLQAELFDHVVVAVLQVPHKYSLALNVKCYARCDKRDPSTAKYLIDVSVGRDHYSD